MTTDEKTIINLSRQLQAARDEITNLNGDITYAEQMLSKCRVPRSFEDGNSHDDLSFRERMSMLGGAYEREHRSNEVLKKALRPFAAFACDEKAVPRGEKCTCHNCVAREALQS